MSNFSGSSAMVSSEGERAWRRLLWQVPGARVRYRRDKRRSVVADHVTAEQRLAILAGFADALPDPCVLIDRRLVVMHRNAAAISEFPGLAPGGLLTRALRNPTLLNAVEAVRENGALQSVELHQTVPNVTWHRADVAPLPGNDELIAITLHSLTEQKRLEQLRSDFIANA
ncbi:MAG: hypothetical protein ABIY37_13260, partial [Devosia sp.]